MAARIVEFDTIVQVPSVNSRDANVILLLFKKKAHIILFTHEKWSRDNQMKK